MPRLFFGQPLRASLSIREGGTGSAGKGDATVEEGIVINGIHAIFYTKHADEMRDFLRDVLGLRSVDAGEGWLIFAAPPTELAVHPTEGAAEHELFLTCDDVYATVARLAERGIETVLPPADRGWGIMTQIRLPGGDVLGLYQPKHPSPLSQDVTASSP